MPTKRQKKRGKQTRLSARASAEKAAAGFELSTIKLPRNVDLFRPSEGSVIVDVVPFTTTHNPYADAGMMHYERTYFAHKGIGPNNAMRVCPAKENGTACPICEAIGQMASDPDADDNAIQALRPKRRQLFNFRKNDEPDSMYVFEGPYYFGFGEMLNEEILDADEDDPINFFADPDEGLSVKIRFKEDKYQGRAFVKPSKITMEERTEPVTDADLERAVCLDDILVVPTYEELKQLFLAVNTTDDDDAEDDEEIIDDEPKPKAKRRGRKPSTNNKAKPKTAKDAGIELDSMVHHEEHGECWVVRISRDGTSLTIEDEDGTEHRAIGVDDVELLPESNDDLIDDEDDDDGLIDDEDEDEDLIDDEDDDEDLIDDEDDLIDDEDDEEEAPPPRRNASSKRKPAPTRKASTPKRKATTKRKR